ncbi:MAG: hypothetical protein RMJ88_05000 [Thermogemmata sp.]|nr:hypothetical protein [Thermogemmata sp.]
MLVEFNVGPATIRRRGVLLIVVLALLSLFAIVGITFVFFAGQKAEFARIAADAQNQSRDLPDDGMMAFNQFLAQLIYPAIVPTNGAPANAFFNALRGHDLTSSMYGGMPGSTSAWSGLGLFDEAVTATEYAGLNRRQIVNFSLFPGMSRLLDPEYSNPAGRSPTAGLSGAYIPKNAPYTYPDINNYFLAWVCPATGEVILPSFHRPWLFGSLDPSNPNWTNPQGRFLTLRPRPAEHPNFPRVPPNADGSYTGDVCNLRGGVGPWKNDSLWMDIGLPVISAPDGKRYKPLVAPLIVDLDGLLNLSVHGNILGGAHHSGSGFGPWEVSLERAFASYSANPAVSRQEARNLIDVRNATLQNRAGINQRAFAPPPLLAVNNPLANYAAVAWGGLTGAPALQIPGQGGANPFLDAPTYTNGYSAQNNPYPLHPSLFNPSEWQRLPSGAQPRAFSLPDLKLLHFAYATYPSVYEPLEVGNGARTTLRSGGIGFPTTPIGPSTPNGYRRDPSHRNRMLFTTYAYALDRPGGIGYVFTGTNLSPDPLAGLPPINLNRPLSDYRTDTTQPLSPTNVGNAAQAQADRQQLAHDIFIRLAAALNPNWITYNPVNGQYTLAAAINPMASDYPTLRQIAQIAVNIVDYIDNDDIMTPFAWDPNNAAEVVYGVEKPRLVINEVYSEVTNDPADPTFGAVPQPAGNPAHVRFWVELHNPTSSPYPTGSTGPLGDGSAPLRLSNGTSTYSVYRLQVVQNVDNNVSKTLRDPLASAGNNRGEPGVAPLIDFDFSPADGTPLERIAPANGNPDAGMVLCAANVPGVHGANEFNPTFPMGAPVIPGAPVGAANTLTYTVPLNQAVVGNALSNVLENHVVLLRRLANPYQPPGPNNPYITVDFMDHVPSFDAIQREAGAIIQDRQPKQWNGMAVQPGYDPIDVPAAGDPIVRRHALGKVQPLAGQCNPQPPAPNTAYPIYAFPVSLVVRQDLNPNNPQPGVRHTFLRRNSRVPGLNATTYNPGPPASLANNETLMIPYDWLVHLDRPLINQLELLHVTAGKPHELTLKFLTPRNDGGIDKFTGNVQNQLNNSQWMQLYRGLDLLRIRPYVEGGAVGGRVPGRININTIRDKRVWDALFDAQPGNAFDQAFVDQMWNALIGSRTPNMQTRTAADGTVHPCPVPGATVYDNNSPTGDRPFVPFGIPTVTPGAGGTSVAGTSARVLGGSWTLNDDTLLRLNLATQLPWLTVPPPGALHPYQSAEAARKIFNNLTTVSHTFAVWVTVGYFEVEQEISTSVSGVNFTRLGREYYREVPGDSRFQFFAIVDRSMIAIDPASYVAFRNGSGPLVHANQRPFFTTLKANAPAGSNTLTIYAPGGSGWSEGQAVPIQQGQLLVVGTGNAMEIVQVQAVGAVQPTGELPLTVSAVWPVSGATLSRSHYYGDCVSNVVPGNPGPQPYFDAHLPQYQSVVPFWTRLQ